MQCERKTLQSWWWQISKKFYKLSVWNLISSTLYLIDRFKSIKKFPFFVTLEFVFCPFSKKKEAKNFFKNFQKKRKVFNVFFFFILSGMEPKQKQDSLMIYSNRNYWMCHIIFYVGSCTMNCRKCLSEKEEKKNKWRTRKENLCSWTFSMFTCQIGFRVYFSYVYFADDADTMLRRITKIEMTFAIVTIFSQLFLKYFCCFGFFFLKVPRATSRFNGGGKCTGI